MLGVPNSIPARSSAQSSTVSVSTGCRGSIEPRSTTSCWAATVQPWGIASRSWSVAMCDSLPPSSDPRLRQLLVDLAVRADGGGRVRLNQVVLVAVAAGALLILLALLLGGGRLQLATVRGRV